MTKERSYEGLVAGMHERPTTFDAEEVLRRDYKVKFPDRRAITMWNTPEISQFRGVQEEMDEEALPNGPRGVGRYSIH